MFAGVKLYAALGLLVVVGGLSLAVWGYKNKAEAAAERLHVVEAQRDHAIAAIKRGEEENKRLKALSDELNKAIVERDKRAQELEAAKRNLKTELAALKKELSDADKACLDRSLPPAVIEWLRD